MSEAPDLNSVLGQSGACPEIELNGKAWKIGHPTQKAKTTLNVLVVQRAANEITSLEGLLPPATTARMFDALTKSIGAKHYQTWHPGWLDTMGSQDGDILFLQSLIRVNHPEATEQDAFDLYANRLGQVKIAMALVMPPFLDLLEKEFPPQIPEAQRAELMGQFRKRYLLPQEPST